MIVPVAYHSFLLVCIVYRIASGFFFEGQNFRVSQQMSHFVGDIFAVLSAHCFINGHGSSFIGKIFVHRLQTTKSVKFLPLENHPAIQYYKSIISLHMNQRKRRKLNKSISLLPVQYYYANTRFLHDRWAGQMASCTRTSLKQVPASL